jgi:hypothetical protein
LLRFCYFVASPKLTNALTGGARAGVGGARARRFPRCSGFSISAPLFALLFKAAVFALAAAAARRRLRTRYSSVPTTTVAKKTPPPLAPPISAELLVSPLPPPKAASGTAVAEGEREGLLVPDGSTARGGVTDTDVPCDRVVVALTKGVADVDAPGDSVAVRECGGVAKGL